MKYDNWMIPLIAMVAIVITLWFVIPEEDAVSKQIQEIEIRELQRENFSLIQTNDLLDSKVELLERITDSLTSVLQQGHQLQE